jgi:hypothetical protein
MVVAGKLDVLSKCDGGLELCSVFVPRNFP